MAQYDMIYFIVPVEKFVMDFGAVHINASLKHQLNLPLHII